MTNPGLGQSLIDWADEIERTDYVEPIQTARVLRRVGEGIDRELASLKRRISDLEAVRGS